MTQPPKIRGVALDMDGLLFDTERLYFTVNDEVLRRRGYRFCRELQQRMMGQIGLECAQKMIDFHELDDCAEDLLAEQDELYAETLATGLQPMPGLSQWIQLLQESAIPFGLSTSSRRRFVDIILDTINWRDSLAFTLTGDDVQRGKPDPEMYRLAAQQLSVDPSEMLVLEDSGNGCASAVAAGAYTVAIPNEHTREHSFDGVQLIVESLSDARLWGLLR